MNTPYMSSVGIASHGLSAKCHEFCLQTQPSQDCHYKMLSEP